MVGKKIRERVEAEGRKVLEYGLRGARRADEGLAEWRAMMGNVNEEEWLRERGRLLCDLRYLLTKGGFVFAEGTGLRREGPHEGLIDALEGTACLVEDRPQTKRCYMYLAARNTYKTAIGMAWALQTALRDKRERIPIATFKQEKATARLGMLRRFLESEFAMLYFPDSVWPLSRKSLRPGWARWNKQEMDLRGRVRVQEPTFSAVSYRMPGTGDHNTTGFMDDPVNEQSVGTEAKRAQQIQVWQFLAACLTNSAKRYVFGTFYDDRDLYNWLLNEGIVDELWVVPAVVTEHWLGKYPWMTEKLKLKDVEPGQLLFPKTLPQEALDDQLKEMGPYLYGCQYLLDPTSKTARLDPLWLQTFEMDQLPEPVNLYMTADPGCSKSVGSSEAALCMGAWDAWGHIWVVDFEAGHWNSAEFAERAVSMWQRWQFRSPKAFGMEKIGFQASLHTLVQEIAEREGAQMRLEAIPGHHLGIYGRVDVLSPHAAALKVHCRKDMAPLLRDQWKRYPDPTGRGMDRLDALAYQFATYTKGKEHGMRWVRLPPRPREEERKSVDERPMSARPKKYGRKAGGSKWWVA